jgi:hypothetical protein
MALLLWLAIDIAVGTSDTSSRWNGRSPFRSSTILFPDGSRGWSKEVCERLFGPVSGVSVDNPSISDDFMERVARFRYIEVLAVPNGQVTNDGVAKLTHLSRLRTLVEQYLD